MRLPFCGLLKNDRLLRCAYHSSLRRTEEYASFLMISYALHPIIFEQPVDDIFNHCIISYW